MLALRKGILVVKLENDAGVNDQDLEESINKMACHPGTFLLPQTKRIMNIFFEKLLVLTVTIFTWRNNVYIHKKHWFTLVEKCFLGRSIRVAKNFYGHAGMFQFGSWPQKNILLLLLITG